MTKSRSKKDTVDEARRVIEQEKIERRSACQEELNKVLQHHRCQLVALQGQVQKMDGGALMVSAPRVGLVALD